MVDRHGITVNLFKSHYEINNYINTIQIFGKMYFFRFNCPCTFMDYFIIIIYIYNSLNNHLPAVMFV